MPKIKGKSPQVQWAPTVHCQLAVARPLGRLGCTDRLLMVCRDCAALHATLTFAPTDPTAHTAASLETCAAGYDIIDGTSIFRAVQARSVKDNVDCDSGGDGAVRAGLIGDWERSL